MECEEHGAGSRRGWKDRAVTNFAVKQRSRGWKPPLAEDCGATKGISLGVSRKWCGGNARDRLRCGLANSIIHDKANCISAITAQLTGAFCHGPLLITAYLFLYNGSFPSLNSLSLSQRQRNL